MDIDVEEDNVLIPLRLRGTRILTPDRQSPYTIFSSSTSWASPVTEMYCFFSGLAKATFSNCFCNQRLGFLREKPETIKKSQSAQSIGRFRSSPFSCTVVNIPTWIDSIISPIFSLSATFDFISPDRIREQDWIPRRGLCPHAFNITIRGSD
jgi:hypothetical protein